MLDPRFKAHLDEQAKAAAAQPAPPLSAIPPAMIRAGYRAGRTATDRNAPQDLDVRDRVLDGPDGPIPVRLYTPPDAPTPGPGVVYFHGGGFVIGDLETHDGHCRRLASASGARVMAVDYRLAPENPFPAGHDDALNATKWAFDHAGEIGFDPARIAVAGDSAGGNLAACVALDLRGDARRKLAFQLLLYPCTFPEEATASSRELDGPILTQAAMMWFENSLAALTHPDGHRAYPARNKDLSGAPPALVVTAGFDLLKDEGRDYAGALADAGVPVEHVEYPSLPHDFYIIHDVSPAVGEALRETAAALKAALA
jgi:acetyl esterase